MKSAPVDKEGNIGFNISICKELHYSDVFLANEIGDVMFRMEYPDKALDSGTDASKSEEEYRRGGTAGDYSFRVQEVYSQRKAKKEVEQKYPLPYE